MLHSDFTEGFGLVALCLSNPAANCVIALSGTIAFGFSLLQLFGLISPEPALCRQALTINNQPRPMPSHL